RFTLSQQRDISVVLRDDHALVINAWGNLDIDAARLTILTGPCERMMIHRHLNCWEFCCAFNTSLYIGRDADLDILGHCKLNHEAEDNKQAHHRSFPNPLWQQIHILCRDEVKDSAFLGSEQGSSA